MAERIEVDADQLDATAQDLAGLGDVLAGVGRGVGAAEGSIGSGRLAHALGEADSGWRVHRERLLGDVQGLSQAAAGAARVYRGVEGDIEGVLKRALS